MKRRVLGFALIGAFLLTASARAEEDYTPVRFVAGNVPVQPPLASNGGVVILEIDVAPSGIVVEATPLADAPPFTEALTREVRLWTFRPAEEDGSAVSGKALVVGVFRPPVLLGTGLPELNVVHSASEEVPYPLETVTPSYPPTALYEGVGLVEVDIDARGTVKDARLRTSAAAYDELALEAAKAFRFRPAHRHGKPVSSSALILFGFRQPVTLPKQPRE